ncbi:MAG: hypothetical protein Q4D32_09800 [Eubacteriales bacterium]|nr:hypothetical protein [Eubacteriales bacterium]
MSSIQNAFAIVKDSTLDQQLKSAGEIEKEILTHLLDPTDGMDDEARKEYEQRLMAKLKSGKRLTSEEMNYLRIHNPSLYEIAVRVERARQALRERLKACKSKEEVQQVVAGQMEVVKAMDKAGDPAAEYMAAMVQYEVKTFHESSQYARLPETREEAAKKKKSMKEKDPFAEEDQKEVEQDGGEYEDWTLFLQGQYHCDLIDRFAVGIL